MLVFLVVVIVVLLSSGVAFIVETGMPHIGIILILAGLLTLFAFPHKQTYRIKKVDENISICVDVYENFLVHRTKSEEYICKNIKDIKDLK